MPSPLSDKLLTCHHLCELTGLVSYVCLAQFPTWSFQAGRARVVPAGAFLPLCCSSLPQETEPTRSQALPATRTHLMTVFPPLADRALWSRISSPPCPGESPPGAHAAWAWCRPPSPLLPQFSHSVPWLEKNGLGRIIYPVSGPFAFSGNLKVERPGWSDPTIFSNREARRL